MCQVIVLFIYISPLLPGLKVLLDPSWMHKYRPSRPMTDILLTERQRVRDEYLSMSQEFFSLPLEIGPSDRGPSYEVAIRATMYLPVPGFEPMFSVLPGELSYENILTCK